MNKMECWGKTSHEINKICYTWTVENYGLLRKMRLDKHLKSPKFPDDGNGLQFCLEISDDIEQFNGLFNLIVRLDSVSDNSVQKCCARIFLPGCAANALLNDVIFGQPVKVHFYNFFSNRGAFLDDERLILHCEVILIAHQKSGKGNLIKIPNCKLAEDLGDILNTQEFADMTIVTADGHKIPVHKIILSARSKVFAAMFRHPMKEITENCIVLYDFNSNVVAELIRFIYTGEAPNLQEMSADLLAAADKYELDRLKAMCTKSMSDNLSIENAHIVLKTAELYDLKDVKAKAIQFVQSYIRDVSDTLNGKSLLALIEKVNEIKLDDDSSSSLKNDE